MPQRASKKNRTLEPEPTKTYYEKAIDTLKNYRLVALLLILITVVANLANLIDQFNKIKEMLFTEHSTLPLVRTNYYTLHGDSISLLLEGMLNEQMQELLESKPIVLKNIIYQNLLDWHNKFSNLLTDNEVMYDRLHSHNDEDNKSNKSDHLAKYKNKMFLPGTVNTYAWSKYSSFPIDCNAGWGIILQPEMRDDDSEIDIKQTAEEKIVKDFEKGVCSIKNISFEKFVAWDDIKSIYKTSKLYDFYNYLSSIGLPDNFFYATIQYDECGQAFGINIIAPFLSLEILAIENISSAPVTINNLTGALYKNSRIVTEETKLTRQSENSIDATNIILKPKETLIIPTKILFTLNNPALDPNIPYKNSNTLSPVYLEKILKIAKNKQRFTLTVPDEKSLVLESSALQSHIKPYFDTSTKKYYHSEIKIEKLVVNKAVENIHPAFTGAIFISHGVEAGSCPFLFIKDQKLGRVLTGFDSENKENTSTISIPVDISDLTLKELEDEKTIIKWVRLKCYSDDGDYKIYTPTNIKFSSNKAQTLEKGEEINFLFKKEDNAKTCYFQIRGYYIPQ